MYVYIYIEREAEIFLFCYVHVYVYMYTCSYAQLIAYAQLRPAMHFYVQLHVARRSYMPLRGAYHPSMNRQSVGKQYCCYVHTYA